MSETINLVIKNTKSAGGKSCGIESHYQAGSTEAIILPRLGQDNLKDRLQRLEGNLKILEKKYKQNLKEGFDHKIKAYRLQAVVERKLLKQAISEAGKASEMQSLRQKLERTQNLKSLKNSRIEMMKCKINQKSHYIKQKKLEDKQTICLSLHEKRVESQKTRKELHDKIAEEEKSVDKKKQYLDYLKRSAIRKDEEGRKQQLLSKILKNTEVLKALKSNLQELRSQQDNNISLTFLTI